MAKTLGEPIRWSEMDGEDVLLELAIPSEEDIERARQMVVPALRILLNAPLVEEEDIIGPETI